MRESLRQRSTARGQERERTVALASTAGTPALPALSATASAAKTADNSMPRPASGFAKALNRSITGSMNDLINHATGWLAEGEISPFVVGFRLNDILLSALARSGSPYGIPREAFKALLGGEEPRRN